MPKIETLFDLFSDFTARWPTSVVRQFVGVLGPGAPTPSVTTWLFALNEATRLANVQLGADGGRASVQADATFTNPGLFPEGWPFVIASMPDVEFRVQTITQAGRAVRLYVSVSDGGADVLLEGLPVEIRLPAGLVQPSAGAGSEVSTGDFTPGNLDDLRVVYRRVGETSVFVHVRLHVTEDGEVTVQPAVPISFRRCLFSGIPCLAVHDFRLVPSPTLAPEHNLLPGRPEPDQLEWLRHQITPWFPAATGPLDGCFAVRSVHLDPTAGPVADATERFNPRLDPQDRPNAEFVLDDLVVPFFSPYVLPIPRHITAGLRRRVMEPDDPGDVFDFRQTPARIRLFSDPEVGLLVESLFLRSAPLEEALGLTFTVVFVFRVSGEPVGIELSLAENLTLLAGFRRNIDDTTGLPEPSSAAWIDALFHHELATVVIDIMAVRVGYSLGRAFGERRGFGDCFEATVDLFISMPPTDAFGGVITLRSLNGERVRFALEAIGWRQGSPNLGGISLPDGVVLSLNTKLGSFGLIIQEIGIVAEQGATYFSFSGGIKVELPSGFEGSLTVRRLRIKLGGGPESAPPFKIEGFFLLIRVPDRLKIEAGGYWTDERTGGVRRRELGFAGKLELTLESGEYVIGVDLIAGEIEAPAETFSYFMVQVFFQGTIGPLGQFELRGIRLLLARNMQPRLGELDRQSQQLRYYSWYRANDPLVVGPERRLSAWRPLQGSGAVGVGVGVSLASMGDIAELRAFVLVVWGPEERGLLIVAELFAFKKPRPIGFVAIEWDARNGRFSFVAGVELTAEQFIASPPSWISGLAKLSGTLYVSNDPGTFAIGRLADQHSWLTLLIELPVWASFSVEFALCVEYVDGGPRGFAIVLRFEGGIGGDIIAVVFHAGLGLLLSFFQTGSSDYSFVAWIEGGVRIVLFRFLRFGISLRVEYRNVGARPSRGELTVEICLETPWFLPDVTWTFQVQFGRLAPSDLATAAQPLRSAAASEEGTAKSQLVHVERVQPWTGQGQTRTLSVNQLRAISLPEATRLANFAANQDVKPVAIDATIAIEFTVAVNDRIGLGANAAPDLGEQRSGDLTVRYDLVGIAVRRRARFGTDRSWRSLEQRVELPPDFSDPNGVKLTGSFGPQQLTKLWDLDVQIGGRPATKKLLLNARVPFEYATRNPRVDEETVRDNPAWPCCDPEGGTPPPTALHRAVFRGEPLGGAVVTRRFSDSSSRLRFLRPAFVRAHRFGTTLPPDTRVAVVGSLTGGLLFRADLDEDAAVCAVSLALPPGPAGKGLVVLLASDAAGKVVGSRLVSTSPTSDFQQVVLAGTGPIRRLEARLVLDPAPLIGTHGFDRRPVEVEVDLLAYIGLRTYLGLQERQQACADPATGPAYEGRGKLFFLPNHDYEVAVTTAVTVDHPSTPEARADVTEYLYFTTKGLPGLNAVPRVGEEVEPYVRSVYRGGRGSLYREEPVALAFSEGFHVAVPVTARAPGSSEEHTLLQRMQLLVQPTAAPGPETPFTATGSDWIVDHRQAPVVVLASPPAWDAKATGSVTMASAMTTTSASVARLATIVLRPAATCPIGDPRRVVGTVLVAPPQGAVDPGPPARPLWPEVTGFTATVRLEASPFVDRRPFQPGDETAFGFALDGGPGGADAWSVLDGELRTAAGPRRLAILGEATWDHMTVQVGLAAVGAAAGVGFGLPAGSPPSRGLFAVIEPAGAGHRLVLYRRISGTGLDELAQAALPAFAAGSPLSLEVTAFDDLLRASVGETTLEVPRGEVREGRLCLLAQGPVRFASLQVTGLDIYSFPFAVSRFRSFRDHIGSFTGTLDVTGPDALGPGTTTTTAAALWAATRADVEAAMASTAPASARQAVFDRWLRELGVPLRDEVTELELTRFTRAGQTELFLLESPEPIDFTEEVTLTVERRLLVQPIPPSEVPPVAAGLPTAVELGRRLLDPGDQRPSAEAPVAGRPSGPPPLLRSVTHQGDRLLVELDTEAGDLAALQGQRMVLAEVIGDGDRRLRLFEGTVELTPGARRAVLDGLLSNEVAAAAGTESELVAALVAGLAPGSVVLVQPGRDEPVAIIGKLTWEAVGTRVLQDGTGLRALVLPVTGGTLAPLGAGTYRLTFALRRQRWATTDPADDLNTYQAQAALTVAY